MRLWQKLLQLGLIPIEPISTTRRALLLARSAFIGWIAMLVVWVVYVFLLPHPIESEIGPFGAFFVFGLVLSAVYLANFLVITAPIYFLSLYAHKFPARWFGTLCGAGLYLLSVTLWCLAYDTRPDWQFYVLAATAGAASAYALSPFHPIRRKHKTEPVT